MIDQKIIRDDIELVRRILKKRHMESAVNIDELVSVDGERRELIMKTDELREKRNRMSKEIGARKARGEDASADMKEVQAIGDGIRSLDERLAVLNERYADMHLSVPNILDESVPEGKDDKDNVVIRQWG
jgi:seryl-tRNA synthetase